MVNDPDAPLSILHSSTLTPEARQRRVEWHRRYEEEQASKPPDDVLANLAKRAERYRRYVIKKRLCGELGDKDFAMALSDLDRVNLMSDADEVRVLIELVMRRVLRALKRDPPPGKPPNKPAAAASRKD